MVIFIFQSFHNTSENSRMCTICHEILEDEKEGKAHLMSTHPETLTKGQPSLKTTLPRGSTQAEKISKVFKMTPIILIFCFKI